MKRESAPYSIDPRSLLQQELERRCERNPRYSVRAFAKALGVSHTLVSAMISGRRRITAKTARKLLQIVPLSPDERLKFWERMGETDGDLDPADRFHQISLDHFSLISDWYHYAILSLMEMRGSKFDARWISRRLGIQEHQAKAAMDRLIRLGLMAQQGVTWRPTGLALKIENTISTPATRKFHHQLMDRASVSLEQDPMELRDFSSMTFNLDPSLIPFAVEKIRRFRRSLVSELERRGGARRVYKMAVQIFPVSDDVVDAVASTPRTQTFNKERRHGNA